MDTLSDPPRPIGRDVELVLTGKCFPWRDDQPVLFFIAGSLSPYLALFDDPDQIRDFLAKTRVEYDSVKQIEDGVEFLASIPLDIAVITNPRYTDEGRVRYFQVRR